MKTIEQYAHDYRDMAMSQEDLKKMLRTRAANLVKHMHWQAKQVPCTIHYQLPNKAKKK